MAFQRFLPLVFKAVFFIGTAIGLGYMHQSRPFRLIGTATMLVLSGVAAFIVWAIIRFLFRRNQSSQENPTIWSDLFSYTVLGCVAFILSIAIGLFFHRDSIEIAQSQLEQVIPQLDRFYAENGIYPQSLTELGIEDFGESASWYLRGAEIYRCQHQILLTPDELPEIRPIVDSHYASNGAEYELCVYNQDMFDTLGTIAVFYSKDGSWSTRVAYSRWEIGTGRN